MTPSVSRLMWRRCDQASGVVALAQREPRLAQMLHRVEGLHPQEILLQRSDEALGAAEFAAWLGMTPRQNSSGGMERLSRTSKRGDNYIGIIRLWTQFVHAA